MIIAVRTLSRTVPKIQFGIQIIYQLDDHSSSRHIKRGHKKKNAKKYTERGRVFTNTFRRRVRRISDGEFVSSQLG